MPVRVPPLNVATPLELVVACPNAVPLIEKLTVLLFRFAPLAVSFAVSVAAPLTVPLPETSEIVRSLSIMLRLRFGLELHALCRFFTRVVIEWNQQVFVARIT